MQSRRALHVARFTQVKCGLPPGAPDKSTCTRCLRLSESCALQRAYSKLMPWLQDSIAHIQRLRQEVEDPARGQYRCLEGFNMTLIFSTFRSGRTLEAKRISPSAACVRSMKRFSRLTC